MLAEYLSAVWYILSLPLKDIILYSCLLLIVVPCFSVILHEAGHYYVAKAVGVRSEKFSIGKGPIIFKSLNEKDLCLVEFRLIPIFGRVSYEGSAYLQLSMHFRAFLSAGGWAFDTLVHIILWLIYCTVTEPNPIFSLIIFNSFVRIVFGLSPLTSDGRKFIHYSIYAIRNYLRRTFLREDCL